MIDNYKHQGLRKKLIELLKDKGIKDANVLAAIDKVPRHLFIDNAFLEFAYNDVAFPIGDKQTISHPSTVAFQSELLQIKKGEKVLEVGTGCGYQTAVLCELGAKVFTIERQRNLYNKTIVFLPKLNYNPKFFYGDGYAGLPTFAPFHKIIVTAGAPFVPEALKHQLAIGGKLIIPVGEGETQEMHQYIKMDVDDFLFSVHGSFKFVPLLENKTV